MRFRSPSLVRLLVAAAAFVGGSLGSVGYSQSASLPLSGSVPVVLNVSLREEVSASNLDLTPPKTDHSVLVAYVDAQSNMAGAPYVVTVTDPPLGVGQLTSVVDPSQNVPFMVSLGHTADYSGPELVGYAPVWFGAGGFPNPQMTGTVGPSLTHIGYLSMLYSVPVGQYGGDYSGQIVVTISSP